MRPFRSRKERNLVGLMLERVREYAEETNILANTYFDTSYLDC